MPIRKTQYIVEKWLEKIILKNLKKGVDKRELKRYNSRAVRETAETKSRDRAADELRKVNSVQTYSQVKG